MKQYIQNSPNTKNIIVILITSLAMFMTNLDVSIVNIALPTLASNYGVSVASVSRIVLVYILAIISLLLVFGRLGDSRGAERVFTAGFIVFSLASLLCAFSWSLTSLLIFRFIQGAGGAMVEATATALMLLYLPIEIRGRAFGINAVFGGVGFAAGAPAGGFLVQYLSWRWIFLVNIPVGILVLVLAIMTLQYRRKSERSAESFDIPGAVLSFLGFGTLLYGLNFIQSAGISALSSVIHLLPAIILLAAFLFYEKQAEMPLLDLSLFNNIHLSLGLVGYMAAVMVLNGFSFLFPFYFESVRHLSPDQVGLLLMIIPLMSIIMSPAAGYLSDKRSPHVLCATAMLGLVISCILLVLFKIDSSYIFIVLTFVILGLALAFYLTGDVTLVMSHALEGKEGILSALIAIFAYTGAALGISLYSLVFSLKTSLIAPNMTYADMTSAVIAAGFKQGAILGLIICILGLIFALIASEKKCLTDGDIYS